MTKRLRQFYLRATLRRKAIDQHFDYVHKIMLAAELRRKLISESILLLLEKSDGERRNMKGTNHD